MGLVPLLESREAALCSLPCEDTARGLQLRGERLPEPDHASTLISDFKPLEL